ncbi:uncharacterized protein LOC108099389 [Drosophila ficusphila]|uniref:uncharacterized protein LOC108099389 n=1 Tax=Drosophila ficusphila TaxID=30025 RepID=UPI0007E74455|nr:uncharacterized protein LOC108099389 [Drosophila ficusphila]
MIGSGRKRKQQLKPRQDEHRSPVKRRSVDIKSEPLDGYPALADYDLSTADIKPDLTELQLQLAAEQQVTTSVTRSELDQQESDSDEDGYSELNYQSADVFCQDEPDDYDPEWSSQQMGSRLLFEFSTPSQQTGLKAAKRFQCPQYYFTQLLGNRASFFESLAQSCNQKGGAEKTKPTNAEEIATFVGLSLLMSDLKLEHLSDYWSNNMFYGFVGFNEKMSIERYRQLLKCLNFDALNPQTGKAKSKDFPLLNFINDRMAELYVCGQQLVLNEPITLWKGRFSYQDDLPKKFRNNLLLLHMVTEQSGLVVKIRPEIVQQKDAQAWVRNSRQLVEHRNELTLKLMEDFQGGRTVYVSKFYGSYGLAYELAKRSTYCTGLLDRNRYGNSKALVHQRLDSNSIATSYATSLMMAKWQRRSKSLYFFSSDCLAIYAKELSLQKKNARPKLIQELDWQLQPGSESRQHLIQYQPTCQDLPADKKLVIFLLNILVHNAYLLYLANGQGPRGGHLKSYAEFRVLIIKSLLKEEVVNVAVSPQKSKEQEKVKEKPAPEAKVKAIRHEPVIILHNGKPARKNCRHCHKGGMLQFSKIMCNSCPDKPGLCQEPCFRLWHDQLKK